MTSALRILALETSSMGGAVALAQGTELLAETTLLPEQRSAQGLAPAIQSLLTRIGWQPSDIRLIAVTQGPGSFTGLRVGVTTAKTMAYALGAEVLGVNTLEVIAAQATATAKAGSSIHAVMDAQRNQLVVATFCHDSSGALRMLSLPQVIDHAPWLANLAPGDIVTGTGLTPLLARLPLEVTVAAQTTWQAKAATVARLAFNQYQAGRRDDLWKLEPFYSRASAAEEKAATKLPDNVA